MATCARQTTFIMCCCSKCTHLYVGRMLMFVLLPVEYDLVDLVALYLGQSIIFPILEILCRWTGSNINKPHML